MSGTTASKMIMAVVITSYSFVRRPINKRYTLIVLLYSEDPRPSKSLTLSLKTTLFGLRSEEVAKVVRCHGVPRG